MTTKEIDWTKKNIYQKLTYLQSRIADAGIKKTGNVSLGYGKGGYGYFQLKDFTSLQLKIADEIGLCFITNFEDTKATLTIVNSDKPDETITVACRNIPIPDLVYNGTNKEGEEVKLTDEAKFQKQIKLEGAAQTYLRRYLSVNALNLAETDAIEESTQATGSSISQSYNTYKQPTYQSNNAVTVTRTKHEMVITPKPATSRLPEEDVPYGDELISEHATAESKKKLTTLFTSLPGDIRGSVMICKEIQKWMDGEYKRKMTQAECDGFIKTLEGITKGISTK